MIKMFLAVIILEGCFSQPSNPAYAWKYFFFPKSKQHT